MRISNSNIFYEFYKNIKEQLLKEGDLIEGKILDILDEIAILDIKDFGIIRASTEKDLNDQKGNILKFIVETSLPDKIQLKPILDNIDMEKPRDPVHQKEEYLIKILKEFHIKDSILSRQLLDNLIKYNIPINEKNLLHGIRVLDKLEQILNINDDEAITLINNEQKIKNILKEDIKNFIIVKPENIDNDPITLKIKDVILPQLGNKVGKDIIKTIAFFIKYKVKPSLNNVKYFLELKDDSTIFSKDFKILEEIIDKKFTIPHKKIIINNVGSNNLTEKNHIQYKEYLDKILNYLKNNQPLLDKNSKESLEELVNKIEFLMEMNEELNFIYLPLNLHDANYEGAMTLIERKKEDRAGDRSDIFINLRTKRLGNIKIACQVLNQIINIKFSNINKEDIELFRSKEEELKKLVTSTGYELGTIEYLLENKDNLLDSLIINTNSLYYLDLQV